VRTLFGQRVFHVYCPWDLPGSVRRFLRRVRPRLLILLETELWPNLIHYSAVSDCRILLANARLSERSARGYARVGTLTRSMLEQLDAVACQGYADGERFLGLGLPGTALEVTGSIKFDREIDSLKRAEAETLRHALAADQRPVLVAASTHHGEEGQILAAFATLRRVAPDCLLVLVPRHPERFQAVYDLARKDWQVSRRSLSTYPAKDDDIFLCDTMGELTLMLSVATIALIGGSLVKHGGQNPLEAAAWEVPVVAGPHMFNFAEISRMLVEAGAMIILEVPEQLESCLVELLHQPRQRRAMGEAAGRVLAENRGAKTQLRELVGRLLSAA
jgi:3-deoxy-D-manno-octulosonic-acid transferase